MGPSCANRAAFRLAAASETIRRSIVRIRRRVEEHIAEVRGREALDTIPDVRRLVDLGVAWEERAFWARRAENPDRNQRQVSRMIGSDQMGELVLGAYQASSVTE